MNFIKTVGKFKWYIVIIATFAAGTYYYFNIYNSSTDESAISFYIVENVDKGEVTSGIETTGEIVVAQQLDLDVYKQLNRIDAVNIANGSHVEEGDVLITFDKSSAYVSTESARVAVAEAELALALEMENATEPSTEIRSLENKIAGYKKSILDAEQDKIDAYQDFLNEDIEAVPDSSMYSRLITKTAPVLSGRYVGTKEGEYVIQIYASDASSGYTYRVSGIESYTESVYTGKAIELGTYGLKITFATDIRNGDTWIVRVPNTDVATYTETKNDYLERIADLDESIDGFAVSLANAEQELEDMYTTDSATYRDLDVEKAELQLQEAQQKLSQSYDDIEELDVIAPFSGTIQDMENVVAGATPTGGTSDSVNLGTLISDTFLVKFSLSATDVAKVALDQRVKLSVTSYQDEPTFEATITEISSLPSSSGVAQYEVSAEITYNAEDSDVMLRDGMLADIEIVEEQNTDALRIPASAVTYVNGEPTVTVVDSLTETQQIQVDRMGIIRVEEEVIPSYTRTIELGIQGDYYVEVLSGLEEGEMILTASIVEESTTSVVSESGFGPGGGEGRRPDNASGE